MKLFYILFVGCSLGLWRKLSFNGLLLVSICPGVDKGMFFDDRLFDILSFIKELLNLLVIRSSTFLTNDPSFPIILDLFVKIMIIRFGVVRVNLFNFAFKLLTLGIDYFEIFSR